MIIVNTLNNISLSLYQETRIYMRFLEMCSFFHKTAQQKRYGQKTDFSLTLMLDETPKVVTCKDPPNKCFGIV